MALSQTPDIKAALMAATQQAYDRGAFGIPTMFVGDEIFFGKERLGQVEDEILKTA
jgi:2-hydroxychromene-2-carboxylate isomerase